MDCALVRSSPARRVTSYPRTEIGTLAWSRDGQFVIFSAVDRNDYCILRVRVEGNRPSERIDMAGLNAAHSATVVPGEAAAADERQGHLR